MQQNDSSLADGYPDRPYIPRLLHCACLCVAPALPAALRRVCCHPPHSSSPVCRSLFARLFLMMRVANSLSAQVERALSSYRCSSPGTHMPVQRWVTAGDHQQGETERERERARHTVGSAEPSPNLRGGPTA